jgi:putative transposase
VPTRSPTPHGKHDVPVPDRSQRTTTPDDEADGSPDSTSPTRERVVKRTRDVTKHAKRLVFPEFSFDRAENWSIHENAFWELQTYTGLRDSMAVTEGARSFLVDSTREKTPLGHVHRHSLRQLPISDIRSMYRQAVGRIIREAQREADLTQPVMVAIDITEDTPFTGNRTGHEDEIIGTKESNEDYAYQWATVQIVNTEMPLVLDAMPITLGDSRAEIVADLLDSAQEFVPIELVLMDREFDGDGVKAACEERSVHYLNPKRKYSDETETIEQMKCDDETVRIVEQSVEDSPNRKNLFLPSSTENDDDEDADEEDADRPDYRREMREELGINETDLDETASPLGHFLRELREEEKIETEDEMGDGTGFVVFQTNHPDISEHGTDSGPSNEIEQIHTVMRFVRWYRRRQEIENGYKKLDLAPI